MSPLEKFKTIKTFVFDVDGVLTDSTVLVLDDGQLARRMNIKDGFALQLAVKKGYDVIVISGAHNNAVVLRLNNLGITDVHMGVTNKAALLKEVLQLKGLQLSHSLFMGDDIPDYDVMQQVGLACCPADAVPEIKNISDYISPIAGGLGCVRDVIEKVLKLNNHWELQTNIAAQ